MKNFRDFLKSSALALAGGILASAGALAADMLPPIPMISDAPARGSVGAGWYLRGDIGYSGYREPEANLVAPGGVASLDGENLRGAVSVGLGAGYRFNGWLRADITADHRLESRATLFTGPFGPADADLSSTSVLANAYLDLGTWSGFTPYVGAGLGWNWNRLAASTNLPYPDHTEDGLAWALMAGVAVDMGRSLALDLGYRYLSLGEARTGTFAGTHIETDRLDAHEARIGLRWSFHDQPRVVPLSRSF